MQNPRNILITGATSGIGRALALAYADAGARLRLTGRDAARLDDVAALCRSRGAAVDTAALDLDDAAAAEKQILAWDDAAAVDLVIANAGISGGSSGGEDMRKILRTNLDGTLNTVLPLLPRMRARRRGQIALMSSMAGWRGMPNAPAYSVSKVAVRALGEAWRPLLAQDGVTVSVIFPGFVKTPLTDVNRFDMPFLMSADDAAARIRRGLAQACARVAFPLPMLLLSRLVAALPLALGDTILMRAPRK